MAYGLTALGAHRLLPRGIEPLRAVQAMVGPDVPAGGSLAVMRANHKERFVVLLMDAAGQPTKVAKVALSEAGRTALDREASAVTTIACHLEAPLSGPRLLAHRPGVLVTAAIPWRMRRLPWLLPADVAASLGAFFRTTQTGHGDCAPWNLLWTGSGWTLVDWEAADTEAAPLTDVFHFVVQGYALLKRPRLGAILAGLNGKGWVGQALRAYSEAAAISLDGTTQLLQTYLLATQGRLDPEAPGERAGWHARQRLLHALTRIRR